MKLHFAIITTIPHIPNSILSHDTHVILSFSLSLSLQPILSEAMLDQHCSDGLIPNGTTPDTYLDVVSLQLAIFLLNVCHVVVVVMESGDFDIILRYY